MKPLVAITVFNRQRETAITLESLAETTDLDGIELVIVDNGSTDGVTETVVDWWSVYGSRRGWTFYPLHQNIGCPRALNLALARHRQPGQPVVKLDNDLRILTPGWVEQVPRLIEYQQSKDKPVAMVGAHYEGALAGRLLTSCQWDEVPLHWVHPVIGHAVWHTGVFMDRVGFFDVLSEDHLYGFEDLIMSEKALALGWDNLVWMRWRIENIQRHNALGPAGRDEHVAAMRPLYDERVWALRAGGAVVTGPNGCPVENGGGDGCQSQS